MVNPHPECLAEVTLEYPFLQARYEEYRPQMKAGAMIDRRHVQLAVFRESEKTYEKNTGERVAHWQRRLLGRFTRNLALASPRPHRPRYSISTNVAARSIIDDNYAWEVWETAARYPHQKVGVSDVPTMHISGEEVWLDTRKIRLRRRLPSAKRQLRPVGLKPRKKEKFPGEWAQQLDGNSICSYPPEDLVIEDYGRFLKKKGKSILSEERSRVEPFTTSSYSMASTSAKPSATGTSAAFTSAVSAR